MQDVIKIWDVKSLLSWSQQYFISKGINQPKLSSELLLADALNFTRMQIYLNFDHIPAEKELAKFKEYILKRVEHTPIQYILQKAFFRNLELYVDENVLIPRPETELLVDRVLNIMSDIVREKAAGYGDFSVTGMPDAPAISLNVLEIGTGSGAIALSLIKEAKSFIAKSLVIAGKNGPAITESPDNEPAGSHLAGDNYSAVSTAKADGPGTEGFGADSIKPVSAKPGGPELAHFGVDSIKPKGTEPVGIKSDGPRSGAFKSFNALQATEIASLVKLKITATEKSRAALEVALRNAKNLLSQEEMKDADFMQADILPSEDSAFVYELSGNINESKGNASEHQGNRRELKGKIDIVVSNPPYISEKNYVGLPQEVRDFEPKCALLAGNTGLEIYKRILKEATALFAGGRPFFVFEIDPNVSPDLQKFISESMGVNSANIKIYKDYNQRDRIMVIKGE